MTNMTPIPRKIDHYRIVRVLGEGGMGRVLLAEDTRTEEHVALKHIHMNLVYTSNYRKRFEREIQIMQNLSHTNLMPLLSAGEYRGMPYYVMPFIDGVSIRDFTTMYGAFTPEQALPVVDGVCSALIYMHSHSVFHRDIKPHNILIARDGTPILTDFGIAAMDNATEQLTNTIQRAGLGTDGYIAPELRGGAFASPRTDVYSLGMTIFEMFARRSLYEVLGEDVSNPLAPIPEALQPVLRRAIDQTPKYRQQTVKEFRREFRRAVKEELESRVPTALQNETALKMPDFRLPPDVKRTGYTNRTNQTNRTGTANVPEPPPMPASRLRENYIVAVMVTVVALMVVVTIYLGARSSLQTTPVVAVNPTIETEEVTHTETATNIASPTDTDIPTITATHSQTPNTTATFEVAFFAVLTSTAESAIATQTQQAILNLTAISILLTEQSLITPTRTVAPQQAILTASPTQTPVPTNTPQGIPYVGLELYIQQDTGLFNRVGDAFNTVLTAGEKVVVIQDTFGNSYFDLGRVRYIVVQSSSGTGWVREPDLGDFPPPTPRPTVEGNIETVDADPTFAPPAIGGVIGVGMTVRVKQETYAVNFPASQISVALLSFGMPVTVVEGPREVENRTWWRIRTPNSDGWVTDTVIEPITVER